MTHTGKGLYGNNRVKRAADLILLERKWTQSVKNQGSEGSQSVGKDEVPSSHLTHTVTHMGKGPERVKECRAGSLRFLSCFFRCLT